MSDKKFLNKVKEFSEYLDHSYNIEKFNLKESYSQSLLVSATIGGSSGGDCWGGRTSDFDKDTSDIVYELMSSVGYTLRNFFSDYIMVDITVTLKEHFGDYGLYDYIAKMSDDSDYYGNHTQQGLYEIPIYPLMKKMLDDEHFQIFKSFLSNEKNKLDKVFVDKKTEKRIKDLNDKITSFEADKTKELQILKDNIDYYERNVNSLKAKLKVFPEQKTKELKVLKSELDKLTK